MEKCSFKLIGLYVAGCLIVVRGNNKALKFGTLSDW